MYFMVETWLLVKRKSFWRILKRGLIWIASLLKKKKKDRLATMPRADFRETKGDEVDLRSYCRNLGEGPGRLEPRCHLGGGRKLDGA